MVRKAEVELGGRYYLRWNRTLVPVCILRPCRTGGWWALSERTGREVRIKTGARLKGPVSSVVPLRVVRS